MTQEKPAANQEIKRTGISRYEGNDGRVELTDIGALIGYFSRWWMVRDPKGDDYTFTGTLAYFNPKLWAMQRADREVTVKIGRERTERLEQAEGARADVTDGPQGKLLVMEHVTFRSN